MIIRVEFGATPDLWKRIGRDGEAYYDTCLWICQLQTFTLRSGAL